jgi:nitroreductase
MTFSPHLYHPMKQNLIESIQKIIRERRTTKLAQMNGKLIDNEKIIQLIELADWAPTHGRTEPWRFFVFEGANLKQFGQKHGELYWENTPVEKQNPLTREKLEQAVNNASHLIISVMKRGTNPKISVLEEIAATSAAIQNMLLAASAMGIAAIWNTGGMAHHSSLKKYLGLSEEDHVMGLIYLGYTDEPAVAGVRNIPLSEKIKWMK